MSSAAKQWYTFRLENITPIEALARFRLWRGVGWPFVTDVSEVYTSPTFKGKSVQDDSCVDWPVKLGLVCFSENSVGLRDP